MNLLSNILTKAPITQSVEFRRAQILERMGVPKVLRHCAFATYDTTYNDNASVVNEIRELARQRKWIIIGGCTNETKTNGIGATHLAIAAMGLMWNNVKDREYWYRFIDLGLDGDELWTMGKDRNAIIKHWFRMDCCLFDEMGTEPDGMKKVVARVIRNAHNSCWEKHTRKQIIATTPFSRAKLSELYGGDAIDRFNDYGKFIELSGKSFRGQND